MIRFVLALIVAMLVVNAIDNPPPSRGSDAPIFVVDIKPVTRPA
jgi:hypothetical protein